MQNYKQKCKSLSLFSTHKPVLQKTARPKILSTLAMAVAASSVLILSGCNKESPVKTETPVDVTQSSNAATTSSKSAQHNGVEAEDTAGNEHVFTRDKPLSIDWDRIDSGQKPVAPDTFKYPFELNGDSVKSQAKFSNITPKQAQHALTVGMASNEPLEKILDQLGDSYLSHKFSESEAKLIIYTTPNVEPSKHDYVIAHEFARGLTLPIEIIPQTADQKSDSAQPATEQPATEPSSTKQTSTEQEKASTK